MPSQTSLSNGARVKATGSHEEGWEQEVCAGSSPRCQGTSTLFAEVEEQEGRGGDAEDQLLHHIRVAPVTGFSGSGGPMQQPGCIFKLGFEGHELPGEVRDNADTRQKAQN